MTYLAGFGTSGIESIFKLIGLIILCIIIIAASYYTTKFVGKKQMSAGNGSNFKPLDVFRLGQNKYLQLIMIGRRYFVIAVSKENVSLIAELSEDDIIRASASGKAGFKDIFTKAAAGLKGGSPSGSDPEGAVPGEDGSQDEGPLPEEAEKK